VLVARMKRSVIRGVGSFRWVSGPPSSTNGSCAPDCAVLHPGYNPWMVRYRRNFVPGGMFFFTVTLGDRRSSALVDHVALLRAAFRKTRSERRFAIDAIVILPDHLHASWRVAARLGRR
jgi:hypothetical protein